MLVKVVVRRLVGGRSVVKANSAIVENGRVAVDLEMASDTAIETVVETVEEMVVPLLLT